MSMLSALSLRDRLTYAYAIALCAGLVLFAAVSLLTVDYALKRTVDARLDGAAHSVIAVVTQPRALSRAHLVITARQRQTLLFVLGSQVNGAVIRDDGAVLFDTETELPPAVRRIANHAEMRPQLATVGAANVRVYAVRLPSPLANIVVLVWRPLDLIAELHTIALVVFSVAVVVIAGSAIVVGRGVAHRGLRPLRGMAALASEIEAHDLSRRLRLPPHTDELGQLCTVFDRMLDRLEAAFERQRQFTGDASHELRAPLSVIRVEADVALRHDREPAHYRRTLEKIVRQAKELEALIAQLLAAARADAGKVERFPVDLATIAGAAAEDAAALAGPRAISIRLHGNGPAYVLGDAAALRRVILSLLSNAVKFAPNGGSVDVIVARGRGRVSVTVRDPGPGFSADGLQHALERFWRQDAARARGGSGLGLAIVKSLVDALGGTIALRNSDEGGAEVTVAFPETLSEPAPSAT